MGLRVLRNLFPDTLPKVEIGLCHFQMIMVAFDVKPALMRELRKARFMFDQGTQLLIHVRLIR